MQLAEALLQALYRAGAREIFGIPGDFALPLFEVIERTAELPLYTLSHQPAVGFAADAATRFGGGIGVAAITYGAGAFNLVNSVAGAYAERSPVVVLSGAPGRAERSRGLLVHHQARTLESQLNVYREITCDQSVLDDPDTASESIARGPRQPCPHPPRAGRCAGACCHHPRSVRARGCGDGARPHVWHPQPLRRGLPAPPGRVRLSAARSVMPDAATVVP